MHPVIYMLLISSPASSILRWSCILLYMGCNKMSLYWRAWRWNGDVEQRVTSPTPTLYMYMSDSSSLRRTLGSKCMHSQLLNSCMFSSSVRSTFTFTYDSMSWTSDKVALNNCHHTDPVLILRVFFEDTWGVPTQKPLLVLKRGGNKEAWKVAHQSFPFAPPPPSLPPPACIYCWKATTGRSEGRGQ